MKLLSGPVLCNYYLTYRCNASCGFCDIWERPSPYVTLDNFRENLISLKKLGVKIIDFTGGEPLLHRDLATMLAEAKAAGFVTTVTTNCLLYPKNAESLAGKIDMLHFSLDSADPLKHNASRKVNCFDHLVQSIDIALALGEKPDILFTVTEENHTEIQQVYEDFALKNNLMLILNPMFSYKGVGEELGGNVTAELRKWASKPRVYLNTAFLDLRENGGNNINNPVCTAGTSTIVISPENKLVMPCYHLEGQNFEIAGQLEDLMDNEEVKSWQKKAGRLPECKGCTINCYMEPSFASRLSPLFFKSIGSTLKYSLQKWIYA